MSGTRAALGVPPSDPDDRYDAICDAGDLTRRQLLIWAGDRVGAGAPVFVEAAAFRVRGPLDGEAFRRAFRAVLAESDALRTVIDDVEGWPRRRVRADVAATVEVVERPPGSSAAAAIEAAAASSIARLGGGDGRLIDATLLRLGADEHAWVLVQHQLVSDAWSFRLVHERLAAHYACERGAGPVPDAPPQFAEYVVHERCYRTSEAARRARAHWRSRLPVASGAEAAAGRTDGVDVRRASIPLHGMTAALRRLAASVGAYDDVGSFCVFASLVAAHAYRTLGLREVVVHAPFANRGSARFKRTIGTFMNVCPLRIGVAAGDTVATLLTRTAHEVWDGARHQAYAVRQASGAQPYGLLVNVHKSAVASREFAGMPMEVRWLDPVRRFGDVSLAVQDFGAVGTSTLSLDCNERLFDAHGRRALREELLCLLRGFVDDPGRRLDDLALASTAACRRAASTGPGAGDVWSRVAAVVAHTPAATAVRAGSSTATYAEIAARATAVAGALAAAGVGVGTVVAVWGQRGIGWVGTLLAIWCARAVYLPLDPRWPASRLAEVLAASGTGAVVTGIEPPPALERLAEGARWALLPIGDAVAAPSGADAGGGPPTGDDLAYVLYTSGSTGRPKGALIEHAGLLNHLDAKCRLLGLGPDDRVAQTAAASFDVSIWQALAPLLAGGSVEVIDDDTARDPLRLVEAVAAAGVTVLEVVPSMLRALLEAEDAVPETRGRLDGLRWLVATGDALSPELCRRWLARHPHVPIVNAYGPTECADDVTHHVVRTPPAPDAVRVPIGRPIANVTVRVLDAALRPVPRGCEGELCIGGIGVGRGYLHDPERTTVAFVSPDPFDGRAGSRLYRTGDRARALPDGGFECLGRLDAQAKIRGHRVEPGEVEAVLCEHPAVRAAAVVVRRDGGDEPRLVAYVVTEPGAAPRPSSAEVTLHAVRAFVRTRLPEAAVPARLIAVAALPLTANGKLDHGALAAIPLEVARDRPAPPPECALERTIMHVWGALLGVRTVGRHDDFFMLGGDSLLAYRMLMQIRGELHVEPAMERFLAQPTVAGLAAAIAAAAVEPDPALEEALCELEARGEEEAATPCDGEEHAGALQLGRVDG